MEIVSFPNLGRRYNYSYRVLLSDTDATGRMRLDAIARVLHNAATLDNIESPADDKGNWILRVITLRIKTIPQYLETLDVTTACSGTGRAWAERRTDIRWGNGELLEAQALWINVSTATGLPTSLSPSFHKVFGPSAQGRTVRPKLSLHPPNRIPDLRRALALRFSDCDIVGHVNNAVHLALVEELVAPSDPATPTLLSRAQDLTIEFGPALLPNSPADSQLWQSGTTLWATLSQEGAVCSTTEVTLAN
ncbi:MAG: acyl-ACP thioesterase domain-containing protein [Ferrimicrobium sp.]